MSKLSQPAQNLLCAVLAARSFDIPIADLTDFEVDQVPELESHDFLQVLDPDGDPSITLGETAIKYADVRWCDREERWIKVRLLPETDLAIAREVAKGRVRTVYETDINARALRQGRKAFGMDGMIATAIYRGEKDEERCGPLVGTDDQWNGPDMGNIVRDLRACEICSERIMDSGDVCLKCDASGGEMVALKHA